MNPESNLCGIWLDIQNPMAGRCGQPWRGFMSSLIVIKTEGKSEKVWSVCSDRRTWSPSPRIAPRRTVTHQYSD